MKSLPHSHVCISEAKPFCFRVFRAVMPGGQGRSALKATPSQPRLRALGFPSYKRCFHSICRSRLVYEMLW